MNVELRKASDDPISEDSQLIWKWRNDPTTRQMSIYTKAINWQKHTQWYQQAAKDVKKIFLMAQNDGKSVATVRFDLDNMAGATLSINVDPQCRGRGVGSSVLSNSIEFARTQVHLSYLIAQIKVQNLPSMALFKKHGFCIEKEENGLYTLTLELQ